VGSGFCDSAGLQNPSRHNHLKSVSRVSVAFRVGHDRKPDPASRCPRRRCDLRRVPALPPSRRAERSDPHPVRAFGDRADRLVCAAADVRALRPSQRQGVSRPGRYSPILCCRNRERPALSALRGCGGLLNRTRSVSSAFPIGLCIQDSTRHRVPFWRQKVSAARADRRLELLMGELFLEFVQSLIQWTSDAKRHAKGVRRFGQHCIYIFLTRPSASLSDCICSYSAATRVWISVLTRSHRVLSEKRAR